jgi:hypothetical protein
VFCPSCRAEYRPGFTRCSDCELELVATRPGDDLAETETFGPTHAAEGEESLRVIWQGDDQSGCLSLCRNLQKAGLYYKVLQTVKSRAVRTDVIWNYQLGVRASQYELARETLGLDESAARGGQQVEEETEDPDSSEFELPEADRAAADAAIAEERERSRSYLKDWFSEDATAIVWQQEESGEDYRPAIELCLKENLIHFSSFAGAGGLHNVCVLPEDEARAREIVREIIDDQPPS